MDCVCRSSRVFIACNWPFLTSHICYCKIVVVFFFHSLLIPFFFSTLALNKRKTTHSRRIRVYRQHGPKTATPASLSIQYPTGRASKLPTKPWPPSRPAVSENLLKTITKKSKKSIQRPYPYLSSFWPIKRISDIWDRLVGESNWRKRKSVRRGHGSYVVCLEQIVETAKKSNNSRKRVARGVDRFVSEIEMSVRECNERKRACVVMTYVCNGFHVSSFSLFKGGGRWGTGVGQTVFMRLLRSLSRRSGRERTRRFGRYLQSVDQRSA